MNSREQLLYLIAGIVLAMPLALAQQGSEQLGPQGPHLEQPGMSGTPPSINSATVRQVQQALEQKGYEVGEISGQWNEQTATALRDYQQAQGLEPSGVLNIRTLSALGIGGGSLATQSAESQ